jgi:hypothetical protein
MLTSLQNIAQPGNASQTHHSDGAALDFESLALKII